MNRPIRGGAASPRVVLCFAAVACASIGMALPLVLATWAPGPDQLEFVAIGYNWVEGRGFLDPIRYSYFLPELHPPAPGAVIRAPLISLLLAVPLLLGARLTALGAVHVVWASAIGAAGIWTARRVLPLAAAVAFSIALSGSFAWIHLSQQILTEATAVGVLLLAIGAVEGGLRSVPGALWLSLITLAGWLARPNLVLILPAVVLTAVMEFGPRKALRSKSVWAYVAGFVLLQGLVVLGHRAAFGVAPYAHYGLIEMFGCEGSCDEAAVFQKEYVGILRFVLQHLPEVTSSIATNVGSLIQYAFGPVYMYAGWVALPGTLWALTRKQIPVELRLAAWLAVAFSSSVVLSYFGYAPIRYPVLGVACGLLPGMALISELGSRLAASIDPRAQISRSFLRSLPLAVVLLVFSTLTAPLALSSAWQAWQAYSENGTRKRGVWMTGEPESEWSRSARRLCPAIHPDALVASPDPYTLYLYCGNAGYRIPPDLTSREWLDRYIDAQAVEYLIDDGNSKFALLADSGRLERVASEGEHVVYHVRNPPPGSRPWQAPAPLGGPRPVRTGSR